MDQRCLRSHVVQTRCCVELRRATWASCSGRHFHGRQRLEVHHIGPPTATGLVRGLALQNSRYRAGLARTTPPKAQQDDWAKLGLLLFFFAYAIAFICAFDKVFGLPQSAM